MNNINNHEDYREVISRIKSLSATPQETILHFEELNKLRSLAIAYELQKYDFTIGLTDTRQLSIAG